MLWRSDIIWCSSNLSNRIWIAAGKLDLYVAAAGFHPSRVLPVVLDVGTMNKELRNDPLYLGLDQDRINGDDYYEARIAHNVHCTRLMHRGGAFGHARSC